MPKVARELSALEVRRLTKPGLHAVGGATGFHLQVSETGARSWTLRIKIGDKRRDLGLGAFRDVPLAKAREKAREKREEIGKGIDPIAEKRALRAKLAAAAAKAVTFDQCAARVVEMKRAEFKSPKHAAQWPATLATYASPVIGSLPVDEIELGHISEVLTPIWTTKTETATRLRQRIEAVLDYATVHGLRSGPNPAAWKGNLDKVLAKPAKLKKVQHHRALAIDEMPAFVAALRQRDGVAARCLEFVVLTACRSGEARGARWSEIDFAAKLWTVPPERMKAGKPHRVPLSGKALALLEALPRIAGTDLVFPAPRGGSQLSDVALLAVMRRMGVDAVPHGARSTFRDWCSERTAYPRDVAEMALAHPIGDKVEAAYRRGELLEKRRRMMADWAAFVMVPRPGGGIVELALRRRVLDGYFSQ
jgi:integrase